MGLEEEEAQGGGIKWKERRRKGWKIGGTQHCTSNINYEMKRKEKSRENMNRRKKQWEEKSGGERRRGGRTDLLFLFCQHYTATNLNCLLPHCLMFCFFKKRRKKIFDDVEHCRSILCSSENIPHVHKK